MDKNESRLSFAGIQAALNVWVGMFGGTMNMDTAKNEEF